MSGYSNPNRYGGHGDHGNDRIVDRRPESDGRIPRDIDRVAGRSRHSTDLSAGRVEERFVHERPTPISETDFSYRRQDLQESNFVLPINRSYGGHSRSREPNDALPPFRVWCNGVLVPDPRIFDTREPRPLHYQDLGPRRSDYTIPGTRLYDPQDDHNDFHPPQHAFPQLALEHEAQRYQETDWKSQRREQLERTVQGQSYPRMLTERGGFGQEQRGHDITPQVSSQLNARRSVWKDRKKRYRGKKKKYGQPATGLYEPEVDADGSEEIGRDADMSPKLEVTETENIQDVHNRAMPSNAATHPLVSNERTLRYPRNESQFGDEQEEQDTEGHIDMYQDLEAGQVQVKLEDVTDSRDTVPRIVQAPKLESVEGYQARTLDRVRVQELKSTVLDELNRFREDVNLHRDIVRLGSNLAQICWDYMPNDDAAREFVYMKCCEGLLARWIDFRDSISSRHENVEPDVEDLEADVLSTISNTSCSKAAAENAMTLFHQRN